MKMIHPLKFPYKMMMILPHTPPLSMGSDDSLEGYIPAPYCRKGAHRDDSLEGFFIMIHYNSYSREKWGKKLKSRSPH